MKSITQAITAVALIATATLAGAQTSADSFADRFNVMESLSGAGPAFHPAPTPGNRADDPVSGLTERQMQARSNEEQPWHPDVAPASSNNGPTFAQTNPHGLPFEYYEALSSKSDAFKLPVEAGAPADATTETGTIVATHLQNAASAHASFTPEMPASRMN